MTIIDQIIRDTQTPPNEDGVNTAIRHRDDVWWGQAMAGIGLLALAGEPFDAFDLQTVGVGEPDHPNRYGGLFLSAARAGVIERVGFHQSKPRPVRRGLRSMAGEEAMSAPAITKRAHTLEEVAEMLQEPVSSIRAHCRTQALRGAYKTGAGKTAPWRIPPAAIDHYQRTRPRQ